MKILVIGKSGQLGGSIISESGAHDVYAPSKFELDIENPTSCIEAITHFQPDAVVNTAAFHNLPVCEQSPAKAFAVNCEAVYGLATICRKKNVKFVTFSTDYVFNGERRTPYPENDLPQPLQIYGISRVAGEHAALAAAPDHAIVIRTCGLYGHSGAASKGGNFVEKRLADARSSDEIEMGSDQTISPTYTVDLARAILAMLEKSAPLAGIYHLVNEGECTWYEFTKAIYELAGAQVKVNAVDRKGLSGEMRRPLYTVLENTRARALGIEMPHWRDALQRYLSYHKQNGRI